MVDAEIELVQHPGGGRAAEQRQRLVDQVVIIEQRAAFFLAGVARDHVGGDGDERAGALAGVHGALALEQLADAVLFRDQPRQPIGMTVADFLGDDILAWLKLGGAEHLEVIVDALATRSRTRGLKHRDMFFVVGRTRIENFDQRRPFRRRDQRLRKEFLFQRFKRVVGGRCRNSPTDSAMALSTLPVRVIQAESLSRLRMASPTTSLKVWSAETTMAVARALPSALSGCCGGFQQHLQRQLIEQLRGRGFVQHREARRDIGLERELVQQPRAEGVDGLHFQPARRFQRRGEQPARPRALGHVGFLAGAEQNLGVELGVVERGPFRQRAEHAVRHIGGRRLGEGDAEDLGRIDAAQQQIDDALRQHMGLAGAGIGRDESRYVGIGGVDLHAADIGRDDAGRGHVSPSSLPPESDHSLTRARWS